MLKYLLLILSLLSTALVVGGCAGGSRPNIHHYSVDTSKIISGNTVWLSWDVEGADSVTLDNGIGAVPTRGRMEVKPPGITAYNLTATNQHGMIVSALIINVVPVVQVASPTAAPPAQAEQKPHVPLAKNESNVWYKGAVMVGADEHWITLRNNPQARNPSWADLIAFLQKDNTDKQHYVQGKFTCGDFAEMLHNNAEAAGIRTAIVAIVLKPEYLAEGVIKHSLNAFETTDRGTIYIDATSSSQGLYADKIADVEVGKSYIPVAIDGGKAWSNMGRIEAVEIFQW